MAAGAAKKVISAARAGNPPVAVTKFFAAAYTGGSAMFSEAQSWTSHLAAARHAAGPAADAEPD